MSRRVLGFGQVAVVTDNNVPMRVWGRVKSSVGNSRSEWNLPQKPWMNPNWMPIQIANGLELMQNAKNAKVAIVDDKSVEQPRFPNGFWKFQKTGLRGAELL